MRVKRILLEELPTLMLVTIISVFAGYIFEASISLGNAIGILVITPAIICAGGNIGTIFGARITTKLHSGVIEPRFGRIRDVYINFIALFVCGLLVSLLIAFVGFFISGLISPEDSLGLVNFIIISVGTCTILNSGILFLAFFIAFISYRRGLDPDNLVAPIVTTIADLIGILSIFLILNLLVS